MHLEQLIFLVFCLVDIKAESTFPNDTFHEINFDGLRLSQTIWPKHYDFTIKTYLPGYDSDVEKDKEFTFEATVRIKMFIKYETDTIILNAGEFKYLKDNCYVITNENKMVKIKSIVPNPKNGKVAFVLESEISSGQAEIVVDYDGNMYTFEHGIYQSVYQTSNGTIKYGVGTQFEPIYARTMVPCFDEPAFKAKWTVTIIHPKGTTALSNQIEIGEPQEIDDFIFTKFKTTVPMSSYLLAISVSDFEYVEGYTNTGLRMRVWVQPEHRSYVKYALQAGMKCIQGMQKLYGEPYPMEKIDMIGLFPKDGAMENYGLVTFVQDLLTYREGEDYWLKLKEAELIAHELSHMWFGNLVTMEWWDSVWLNEGFATFAENAGKQLISDGIWDGEDDSLQFLHEVFQKGNKKEKMPLVPNSNMTNDDIRSIFFDVYKEGAAVLLMFKYLIGKDFDLAIRRYLKSNKFQNVDSSTLITQLQHVIPRNLTGPRGETPLDFANFSERWLKQPGFPLLFVEEINESSVRVTQKNELGYKWDVPVFVQEKNHKLLAWLPFDKDLVITQHSNYALVLNYDSYVVAKVNYTRRGWKRIFKQLQLDHTVYSDRTKYRLISDAFYLSGIPDQELIDAFTPYLIKEKAYLPWLSVADSALGDIELSEDLIDVLHKKEVPHVFSDDASYVESRVKKQQNRLYCRFVNACTHRRSVPISARSLLKIF